MESLHSIWWQNVRQNQKEFELASAFGEKYLELINHFVRISHRHFPGEDDSCYVGPRDDVKQVAAEFLNGCRALFVICDGIPGGTR